jgi:hypothetical protein
MCLWATNVLRAQLAIDLTSGMTLAIGLGTAAQNVLVCRRCHACTRTRRRCCGRWTFSSTPPSTAGRSRSPRWSTSTPASRCCTWWSARSPASGSSAELERCSTRPAGCRKCWAGTTARSLFPSAATIPSAATVLRRQGRAVLYPAGHNGYIEWFNNRLRKSASNRNHWNLLEARGGDRTSNTSTTTGTATQLWAI